jgi:hypothetical protein
MKMFQTMYVPFDNDQKFVGVDDFMIRRNRLCDVIGTETRLELWVRRTNDTEDSISWMACFEGSTTVRMKLISAMKLAIHSHPFDLERRAETMIFADLFLDKNAAVLPTEFDKNEYHQWIFKETDAEFKDTWVTYYRRIAGRKGIVCKRCSPQPITDADGWTMV